MKSIFSRTSFPKAPGGNGYEWKAAETLFDVSADGLFVIKIEARAKNAKQNRETDDDDLRLALDGFDFGKYERNEEMISWKGFGTSASWDGASLKGGTKTIYFFFELDKGRHTLCFFADKTPILKNIEIFEIQNNAFELHNLTPPEKIKSNQKGIPWLSFIFLGSQTKNLVLRANAKSSRTKGSTDGDNLKVVINGKILKNKDANTSRKYENFYFAGDIKESDILLINHEAFSAPLAFENAVELWYDERPEIVSLSIEWFNSEEFFKQIKDYIDLKEYILSRAHAAISYFQITKKPYSAQFLEHSITKNPHSLIFQPNDPLAAQIRRDPVYKKLFEKIKEKISTGVLNGEIWPDDFTDGHIDFDSDDLATAIHGIKKVQYKATPIKNKTYKVDMTLFDVYDFAKINAPRYIWPVSDYLKTTTNNFLDNGENLGIIRNYEIEISINEKVLIH